MIDMLQVSCEMMLIEEDINASKGKVHIMV